MLTRGNPLGIAATGQVVVNLTAQVKELHDRVKSGEEDRADWINKQRILIEQRRGIRKPKTIPWVGANNDSIPLVDGVVRRWKPGMISLVMDADPVAYFFATKPDEVEAARSAQAFYHWKFHQIPSLLKRISHLSDLVAQHGIAYTRQGWDYQIERTCRVVSTKSLFPNGIDAAVEQANAQIAQLNDQIAQAQAAGQPNLPAPLEPMTPEKLVADTLKQEYKIDENDRSQSGGSELDEAVQKILSGAEYVKVYYAQVICDRPTFSVLSPLDVVLPVNSITSDSPDFVAIVHRMSADDIRRKVRDGVFREEAAEEAIQKAASRAADATDVESISFDGRTASSRAQIADALDEIEGVSKRSSQRYQGAQLEPIWELFCKLDVNGDGILERCILWYHPASATILSVYEYPFPFREWPVVPFYFEYTSDRPYQARGVTELLSTYQKLVNKLHNSRLDAVQVLLSPMFKMRAVNGEMAPNIKYRPGTIIPLADVGDLEPVIQDFRPLGQFLQEENYTKTLAEQYIGVFDQTLTQMGGAERRTATEVEAVNNQISQVFSGDAGLFQESFATVHNQLWQLWLDFGPDEEYFRVTGEDKPTTIRKDEINKNFDIYPAGTPANTNKSLALARAREMLQLLGADMTGLINKHVLYREYVSLMDRNLAKIMVRSPEEAAAVQTILAAAGEVAERQGQKGAQFAAY